MMWLSPGWFSTFWSLGGTTRWRQCQSIKIGSQRPQIAKAGRLKPSANKGEKLSGTNLEATGAENVHNCETKSGAARQCDVMSVLLISE